MNKRGKIKALVKSTISPENQETSKSLINKSQEQKVVDIQTIKTTEENFAQELMNDTEFPKELIKGILDQTYKYNVDFIRNELYKNPNVPRGQIANIAQACSVTYQDKSLLEINSTQNLS